MPTPPTHRSVFFLAMVAVLPLHTVYLRAWVSWKPWLVLLAALTIWQLVDATRAERGWPWQPRLTIAAGIFLVAAAASWSGAAPERYARLLLALVVGALLLLVCERELRVPGMVERTLRVVFWSSAVMAATAAVFAVVSVGVFGDRLIPTINRAPLVDRVAETVYRRAGMVAVTNWHQDPGYAAAWTNLWAALAALAALRGLGTGRWNLDALVVGTLWFGVIMTLSRTGLLGVAVTVVAVLWRERGRAYLRAALRLLATAGAVTLVLVGALWLIDRPGVGGDVETELAFRLAQGLTLGPGEIPGDDGVFVDDSRGIIWPLYIGYIGDHPFRGIGLGTGWATVIQEPHNIVLELLAETGIVGFAGFLLLLAAIFRRASNPIGRTALVIAFTAAMTQTVLFEPTWWFAAALAMSPALPRHTPQPLDAVPLEIAHG